MAVIDDVHNDLLQTDPTTRPQQDPVELYINSLSEGSKPAMRSALKKIATIAGFDLEAMPWHALRAWHVSAIASELRSRYAPATANKMISALTGVIKALWAELGVLSAEEYYRAAGVKRAKGVRLKAGRALKPDEVESLLNATDNTPKGLRDAAIIALMIGCGLRRAEVAGLTVDSLDFDRMDLRVIGKGNKERLVPVPWFAMDRVIRWLNVRGAHPGNLFLPIRKGQLLTTVVVKGVRRPASISPFVVWDVVRRAVRLAGIRHASPHDFRRTYITMLLERDVDYGSIQRIVGHADIRTTARYDHRALERAKEIVREATARMLLQRTEQQATPPTPQAG